MNKTVIAFQERAAARRAAADRLQALCSAETDGLVKEELTRGVSRMLIQELEYLEYAESARKLGDGAGQP